MNVAPLEPVEVGERAADRREGVRRSTAVVEPGLRAREHDAGVERPASRRSAGS